MELSNCQTAIVQAYNTTQSNLLINAGPGSGKSFLLRLLANQTPAYKRAIFLSFNKSIAEENAKSLPSHISSSTLHSLGFKCLFKLVPGARFMVNEIKTFIIIRKKLKLVQTKFRNEKVKNKYFFELSDLYNLYRINLVSYDKEKEEFLREIESLCLTYDFEIQKNTLEDFYNLVAIMQEEDQKILNGQENIIDFTDMLHLLTYFPESSFPKYDVVFADEVQDLNPLQKALFDKIRKRNGRFVAVGDKRQCQPEGTKVTLSNGKVRNIEDLKVGDRVVGYIQKNGSGFQGYFKDTKNEDHFNKNGVGYIKDIKKRIYEGNLVKVKVGEKISSYTLEHTCYARWSTKSKVCYALYLMQKGDWFRIGMTSVWHYSDKNTSYIGRASQERTDKMWILKVSEDKREVQMDEQFYSSYFGIPQMVFNADNGCKFNQSQVIEFYNKFGDLTEKGISLLKYFNREYEFPLWTNKERNYNSKLHIFELKACNLIEGVMEMVIFDPFELIKRKDGSRFIPLVYSKIDKISFVSYKGNVYSLEVNRYRNYIADGILTHNCIYAFQGSNINSFKELEDSPNTVQLPLDISYRCSQNVISASNLIFPDLPMSAFESNVEGIVRVGTIDEVTNGDFILCRNNRPLMETFIELLKLGKTAHIYGKDYGETLLRLLGEVEDISEDQIELYFNEKLRLTRKMLEDKGIPNPTAHPQYTNLMEKVIILDILYKEFLSYKRVVKLVQDLFTDKLEMKDSITLLTIHKSKGLEADRVFFLSPSLVPSIYAISSNSLYSEKCLYYVAITRARKELIYLKESGIGVPEYNFKPFN